MSEQFARTTILFRQYLKRDWRKILVWVVGLSAFSGAYVPAFKKIASGQGLVGMFETMKNPAMVAMVGPSPVKNVADYTIGAMYTNEMLLFCGLFAMIISALHVVGHTRKEEDLGLTELVRSFKVGRQANSLAVLLETVLINFVLGALTAVIMASFQVESIDFTGAILFGVSLALAGILGAVFALVIAQIMPNSSGTISASLGFIGLLYILRASSDVSAISWSRFNPISWIYLTKPFTDNLWWPIIIGLVTSLLLILIAFGLEQGRDLGASYLPEREGHAHAHKSLLSLPGLQWRINRGVIISWLVGFIVMGAAYGSIYGNMQTFIDSNELIKQMFANTGTSIDRSFTGTIIVVIISLVAILPIVIVNRLTTEETRGHFAQLYVTKMTRIGLYGTTVGLALFAGILGLLFGSLSLGGTALIAMPDSTMALTDFLAAGFNFLPIIVFYTGLAALALGWLPQLAKVVYIYLTYAFMLDYFSGILDLPDWLNKTAIQTWIPKMPVKDFDLPTFLTILGIGICLIIVGSFGYQHRDLHEEA